MAKASPAPDAPSPPLRRSSSRAARCCCAKADEKATARIAARSERLPCSLTIEMLTPRGAISAPVYEISMDGILVSGAAARALAQGQSFNATLQDVGACRIRIVQRSKAGAHAQFEAAGRGAEREDRRQVVGDPGRQHRGRDPRDGSRRRADRRFSRTASTAARSRSRTCSTPTMSRSPAATRCSTAPECWTGPIARCRRSRTRSWPRTSGWRSAP